MKAYKTNGFKNTQTMSHLHLLISSWSSSAKSKKSFGRRNIEKILFRYTRNGSLKASMLNDINHEQSQHVFPIAGTVAHPVNGGGHKTLLIVTNRNWMPFTPIRAQFFLGSVFHGLMGDFGFKRAQIFSAFVSAITTATFAFWYITGAK